jgi:hypothetical protein
MYVAPSLRQPWRWLLTACANCADVRRARVEHYVSRAAYKLIQMDDKLRLLRRGMCVVDCGARPGVCFPCAVLMIPARLTLDPALACRGMVASGSPARGIAARPRPSGVD